MLSYSTAVSNLKKQYLAALQSKLIPIQRAGQLKDALTIKDEIESLTQGKDLAEGKIAPEAVKSMRETYLLSISKLDLQRDKQLFPITSNYRRDLNALAISLTKGGKLDAAKFVLQKMNEIVMQHAVSPLSGKLAREIRFQGTISAGAYVKVQNGQLWFEDKSVAELPVDLKINGASWKPNWNGNTSEKIAIIPAIADISDANIEIKTRQGRGSVQIIEQPNVRNGQTLTIFIYDLGAGFGEYRIIISW